MHLNRLSTGFEALTENVDAVAEIFGDSVVIERATLEDIMFHLKGGVQRV